MSAVPIARQVEWHEKLRAPFPASQVDSLPRAGISLSYVGHAAVTARLLDVDPLWTWEPVAIDDRGLPAFEMTPDGRRVGLWIQLSVCGVTRIGYGSCNAGQQDAEKVLIGDAIRNAAMRFGVALELWSKGGLDAEPVEERPYMSALNIKAFIDRCAEAGCSAGDRDKIVRQATDGRATDPVQVFADEVTVLRAALESWVSERLQVTERFKAQDAETDRKLDAQELGEPVDAEGLRKAVRAGKSVPKRPLAMAEGITDVKTDGALL